MSIEFSEQAGSPIRPFRYFTQKVLPAVYDDSLSYMELVAKTINYLNEVIEAVNANSKATVEMQNLLAQYKQFMDDYFNNLNVQEEIDNKLDAMAANGTLAQLMQPIITQLAPATINQWLNDHPEATTTVQDNSITNAKLVQEGGILSEVIDLRYTYNNVWYPKAGDAVDAEVQQLHDEVDSNSLALGIPITIDFSTSPRNIKLGIVTEVGKTYYIAPLTQLAQDDNITFNNGTDRVSLTSATAVGEVKNFTATVEGTLSIYDYTETQPMLEVVVFTLPESEVFKDYLARIPHAVEKTNDFNQLECNTICSFNILTTVQHGPTSQFIGTVATIGGVYGPMSEYISSVYRPNDYNLLQFAFYQSTSNVYEKIYFRYKISNTWKPWVNLTTNTDLEPFRIQTHVDERSAYNTGYTVEPGCTYRIVSNTERTSGINIYFDGHVSENYVIFYPDVDVIDIYSQTYSSTLMLYTTAAGGMDVDFTIYKLTPRIMDNQRDRVYYVSNSYTNILEYGKTKVNVDFTSLTQCLLALKGDTRNKTIKILGGEYNIFQEYTNAGVPIYSGDNPSQDYFDYCVWVPENTHIIGIGNPKIVWAPSSSAVTTMQSKTVSPLNTAGSCIIENLEILCKNGRYALHADALGKARYMNAKQVFKNCRFYKYIDDEGYGFNACVGIGFDNTMTFIFEDCIFDNRKNFYAFYGHDKITNGVTLNETNGASVLLKNCAALVASTSPCAKFGNTSPTAQIGRITVKMENCFLENKVSVINESESETVNPNHFDITLLNCSNVPVEVADTQNRFPPKIYNI